MPELPEIEHLARTLAPRLCGTVVRGVTLHRADVVREAGCAGTRLRGRHLLLGETITGLRRHGKQLALTAASGATLCVHLGMSGQLQYVARRQRLPRPDHVHCVWRLGSPCAGRLVFRDPRRFGGLWSYASPEALLAARWSALGPDALTIDARALRRRLGRTRRPLKAALLDQGVLAGVGNIYADEALFAARLHPAAAAGSLGADSYRRLAGAVRRVLRRAVASGGSTFRDYVDGNGRPGGFVARHKVYGRAGLPCPRCGRALAGMRIAGRATVFCAACQRMRCRPTDRRGGIKRSLPR